MGTRPERRNEAQVGPVAFVGVNLIPMDRERVVKDQTVVVRRGRIAQAGDSASIKIPPGAVVVDGRGNYLMPGLADMHTHTWGEADFVLFIANGVTTIRNMWGTDLQLAWREGIANGTVVGPTIYTAGPLIDGSPPIWNSSKVVMTREEAEAEVAREKELGYDFIKVYNRLTLEAYQALVASARRRRMPVSGHIPNAVGLLKALESGQDSIEHLQGYIEAIQSDASPVRERADPDSRRRMVEFADEKKIPGVVAATLAAGSWNCVTLVVLQKFVSADDARELLRDPRMRFVPPDMLAGWDPTKDFRLKDMKPADFALLRVSDAMRAKLTRELHRAGARVLLGTDTPNPFVIPGFSIHEELRNLVNAGLTPFEAINAGTRGAAEYLNALGEFGTIEVGARADLILLKRSPLESVTTIADPLGVMVRGRWFPKDALDRMLEDLVATYTTTRMRLGNYFVPFAHEKDVRFRASYLVKWAGTLLGEERLVLGKGPRGGVVISSQLMMSAPPRINGSLLRLECDDRWIPTALSLEGETSMGKSGVNIKRKERRMEIKETRFGEERDRITKNESEDVVLGSPHVATYVPLMVRVNPLGVGESAELRVLNLETYPEQAIVDGKLRLERRPDAEVEGENGTRGPCRVYGFIDTRTNASYTGRILVGKDGKILLFEREEQMGQSRFELVRDVETCSGHSQTG